MASVIRDQSPYWRACYTAADGRQLKRSTKEKDRTKALAIAKAWEEMEAFSKEGANTSKEQFRRLFQERYETIFGEKTFDPSFREWATQWLDGKKGVISDRSHGVYCRYVQSFFDFLGSRADLRLSALTKADVIGFRETALTRGCLPQTANDTLKSAIYPIFRQAAKAGIINFDPTAQIENLKEIHRPKGIFRPSEVARIVEAAKTTYWCGASPWAWVGLVLVGYFTGARINDVIALQWGSVDLIERSLSFRQSKTGNPVRIPIHPELFEYLDGIPSSDSVDAPLFPSLYQPQGTSTGNISCYFGRLMTRAGVDNGLSVAKRRPGVGKARSLLSYHSFRHTFASALAAAGVRQEIRQQFTGHLDADVHQQVYTHHEFENLRIDLEKMPGLPKGEQV
jgi:integrase